MSARDLNFTVPFVWARMNELIRNRTPPIRIRVESQEIEENSERKRDEFLLNFVFVSAFFYYRSIGKKFTRKASKN